RVSGEDEHTSEAVRRGLALLAARPPNWDVERGTIDFAYWRFGTMAAFQAGGDIWHAWNLALTSAVANTQHQAGQPCMYRGSWDPVDAWSPEGGRVYATAMLAMCLQVYYRYDKALPCAR